MMMARLNFRLFDDPASPPVNHEPLRLKRWSGGP
jgi:hypothetical protein